MTREERNRRALVALVPAVVVIVLIRLFSGGGDTAPAAAGTVDSIPQAERRLERLRRLAATVPAREVAVKQARQEVAEREKHLLAADTASQAQAQLLQIVRRVGKDNAIDVRGGEIGPVRALGDDYGEVAVSVLFDCQIDKLVNFLAGLSAEPEALATSDIRIASTNSKQKAVSVRVTLSGVVRRGLVPAKKGPVLF